MNKLQKSGADRTGRTTKILVTAKERVCEDSDDESHSESDEFHAQLTFTPSHVESLLLLLPDQYAETVVLHILGMHPNDYEFSRGNPVSTAKEEEESDADIKALCVKKRKMKEVAYDRIYNIKTEPDIGSANVSNHNLRLQAFLDQFQKNLKEKCPEWCSEDLKQELCAISHDDITIPSRVDDDSPNRDGGPYKILLRRTKDGAPWKSWTVTVTPRPIDRLMMDLATRGHMNPEMTAALCNYIHVKYGPGNISTADPLLEDRIRSETDDDVKQAMANIALKRSKEYAWSIEWFNDLDIPDASMRLHTFLHTARLFMKMTRAKNELCEYLTYAKALEEFKPEEEFVL